MDTPNSPKKAAHLLDDLESIRQLLDDEGLQPPLLTEMVGEQGTQIPLLDEVFEPTPTPTPATATSGIKKRQRRMVSTRSTMVASPARNAACA